MPAASPLTATSDLVTFAIKANGTDVDERYEIMELVIEQALNRIPSARIVIRDGSAASESFVVSAGTDFAPGVKIQLLAGYHGSNTAIFSGVIVKSSVQVSRNGTSSFTFVCRDSAVAMTVSRNTACYTSTTDSDVLSTLIGAYGLSATVASTPAQIEEMTQYAATDWDFLLSRAEANGFVVNVADGKVTVQAPKLSGSPVLSVTYGLDIYDVSLEEDVRTQLSSVSCTSWDPATQAVVTSSVSATNTNTYGSDETTTLAQVTGSKPYTLNTTTPLKSGDQKTWADARLLKASLAKIRGTVRFPGSAAILPDNVLTVAGLGDRFDGNAYVTGVTHEIRNGDWTTEVTIGLDPAWFAARPDVSSPPAHALLPGIQGLQIGTVKQITQDPANEFRVGVIVPFIDASKVIWARLARPYATKNAGWYFYPEVGDEVVLAFLDSDPRFAVILGSLYSSQRNAPFTPDDKNSQKAIVTNAQLKVLFDDEKKVITLITPGNNSIVISDDQKSITLTDQNSNSVKLGTDGITLTSASDVVIKAAQNITLEAQSGTLTAKGTQGVSVSGLKVALSADTEFTASGNATASLTSSGQAKIQGSIVMIN